MVVWSCMPDMLILHYFMLKLEKVAVGVCCCLQYSYLRLIYSICPAPTPLINILGLIWFNIRGSFIHVLSFIYIGHLHVPRILVGKAHNNFFFSFLKCFVDAIKWGWSSVHIQPISPVKADLMPHRYECTEGFK